MKTITTSNGEFLFVEVPKEVTDFKISGTGFLCGRFEGSNYWSVLSIEPPTNIEFITTTDTITEGQASLIVDMVKAKWYVDYMSAEPPFIYPTNSFATLLLANSITTRCAILKLTK